MRLWTLHPKYLDSKGLVALWREALLAQAIIKGNTKAYARHPQLVRFWQSRTPIKSIAAFLRIVHAEGSRRGFKFDIAKIGQGGHVECIAVTRGQINYEWDHFMAKLLMRDPQRFKELKSVRKIDPNPLFKIIQGGVEEWEKIKTPPNHRLELTASLLEILSARSFTRASSGIRMAPNRKVNHAP